MKYFAITLFLMLIPGIYAAQTLQNGLQVYYQFDGNTADSSGNNRHGQAQNGPTYASDRHGNPNSAISLDGANDFVSLSNANFLIGNAFSLSTWVYLKSWASSGSQDMLLNIGSTTYDHGLNAANDYLGTYDGFTGFSYNASSGNAKCWDNTFTVQLNTWYHLVLIRDGQKLQLFINGQLVDDDSVSQNAGFTQTCGLWVGSRTGSGFFAHANVDEVRAYNRVLTANEVNQLFNPENPNPDPDFCLSYHFNSNYNDSSVKALHLTNYGGTLTSDRFGVPNSAIKLNGSNQYLNLNDADVLISESMTISAWVSVDAQPSANQQSGIVCLGDQTYDHGINFANNYLGTYTGFTGYSYTTPNSNASAYMKTGGNFGLNTWYYISMTRDNQWIKLFVNGVPVDSSAQSAGAGFNISGNQLWVGGRYGNQSFLNGKVDDLLICNYVKTNKEILDLYNQGGPMAIEAPHQASLLVYPNPSAGSCQIITDELAGTNLLFVYNSLGQLVQSHGLFGTTHSVNIEGSGMYFIKIVDDKGNIVANESLVIY
ncbi:MAG: LamG-like jellyroll fold domain-containing protein [Bacteroidia bacterium]